MAKRFMTVSDLTGNPVEDDSDVVTIVVYDHPLIEQPVQLDAAAGEVEAIGGSDKDYAVFEIISDGGDKKERMVLEVSEFEKLFSGDVDEILAGAERYTYGSASSAPVNDEPKRRGRPAGSGAKPAGEKVNYKELPHAGTPHRGRTTEEEAAVVRANLDEVNRNRVAAGHKPIDPMDEKDAARYGFDQIKPEDRPQLAPEFKS